MTEDEMITLLSLDDAGQANIIKNKLENEGIVCMMNNSRGAVPAKTANKRSIDLRVFMKDLDKALKMIENEEKA